MEKQEFIEARRKAAAMLINESHADVETCAVLVTLTGDDIGVGMRGSGMEMAATLAQAMVANADLCGVVSLAIKAYEHAQEQKDRLKNEE